jgi:hypothetical protein
MPPIGSNGGLAALKGLRESVATLIDLPLLPRSSRRAGSDVPQTPYRLHMERLGFDDHQDGPFSVEERSAGADVVRGTDEAGRAAEMVGEDSEDLVPRCHADAVTRRA